VQGSLVELDDLGDEHTVWKNLILPAIAIGLRPVAIITQLTRSSMLEVLSQDFIRTAKAKGLSYYTVIMRHALRNALNPVVTAVSGWFASLLAGAFFVESVFNFKGIGDVMVTALLNFDIPVVLGAVLFTAAIFVVVNILADLLYAVFDPRVRNA
jgi:peptide/nickel transport system permease protein